MDAADRELYHQIHPAKLAADIVAELVSLPLIWAGRRRSGLLLHFALPMVGSAIVLRRTADLECLRRSAAGRYVRTEMTPAMQAVRLAGDGVATVGAWRRSIALIAAGAALVLAGWTLGPRSGSVPSELDGGR